MEYLAFGLVRILGGGEALAVANGQEQRLAIRRECDPGRPMRDPARLIRLFEERLDALADPIDPGFGFDMLRLSALMG